MEDVLQLIRDQSVTLRDPQQVSEQLEGLVQDVEQTEQSGARNGVDLRTGDAGHLRSSPLSLPERLAPSDRATGCATDHGPTALERPPRLGPGTLREILSRTIAMFVLHGNVRDLVRLRSAATRIEFLPLTKFLREGLFGRRDIVLPTIAAAG